MLSDTQYISLRDACADVSRGHWTWARTAGIYIMPGIKLKIAKFEILSIRKKAVNVTKV